MRELTQMEMSAVGGGVGECTIDDTSGDVTAVSSWSQDWWNWDPAESSLAMESGGTATGESTLTVTGSLAQGMQTAIADCANGAQVGMLGGAAVGLSTGGVSTPVTTVAGGAAGCLVGTAVGIANTATND